MNTAVEQMAKMVAERLPVIKQFNMNKVMLDWIAKTFTLYEDPSYKERLPEGALGAFYGTPIYEVEYLTNMFIEAEMSDGTRKIIDMRKK